MAEALYVDVDPHSFIQYAYIKKPTKAGILRFVLIISSIGATTFNPAAVEIVSGTHVAIIVSFEDADRDSILSFLKARNIVARILLENTRAGSNGTEMKKKWTFTGQSCN